MPKEIWTTDIFGLRKELKGVIKDDGRVWEVDALGLPKKHIARIDPDGSI